MSFRGFWNAGTYYYVGDSVVHPEASTYYRKVEGQSGLEPGYDPVNWILDNSPIPKGKHERRANGRAVGTRNVDSLILYAATVVLEPYKSALYAIALTHSNEGSEQYKNGVRYAASLLLEVTLVLDVWETLKVYSWSDSKHNPPRHEAAGVDMILAPANQQLAALINGFQPRAAGYMANGIQDPTPYNAEFNRGVRQAISDVEGDAGPGQIRLQRDQLLEIAWPHGTRKNAWGNPK